MSSLIEAVDRSVGSTRGQLEENLADAAMVHAPERLGGMARAVLLDLVEDERQSAVLPRDAREAVFSAWSGDRLRTIEACAGRLGVDLRSLEESLFADLPPERVVTGTRGALLPCDVALRVNLAFAQSLLFRSTVVRLWVEGQAHRIVRQARWGGLIATVEATEARAVLSLSGPLSVCHRTLLYGRALARLLPVLVWTKRFGLEAELVLGGEERLLRIASPAPIFPSAEPEAFDSKLEARFARDFARRAPEWELLREPEAVRIGASLVFPDFLVRHRLDPSKQAFIELVGFWTPAYLEGKVAMAAAMTGGTPLVLCVDEALGVEEGRWPPSARVVPFRGKIDVAAVLMAIVGVLPQDAARSRLTSQADEEALALTRQLRGRQWAGFERESPQRD